MKKCTICNKLKPEEDFYKKVNKRASHCSMCEKEIQKNKYIKNKNKIKSKVKQWSDANKDKVKQNNKNWRLKNIEHIKNKRLKYNDSIKNRERIRKRLLCKDIRKGVKGTLLQIKLRIRSLISVSIKKQNYTKKSKTHELLGCSYEDFLCHVGFKPEGNYHLDHICPCSQAQNEEELIKLQHYTNFKWLRAEDNLSKSARKTTEAEEMCYKLLQRAWID